MDMSDPRVVAVLAHAEACREASSRGEDRPAFGFDLKLPQPENAAPKEWKKIM